METSTSVAVITSDNNDLKTHGRALGTKRITDLSNKPTASFFDVLTGIPTSDYRKINGANAIYQGICELFKSLN